jgi:radical SAM protein (TIGR01212 family)
MKPYYRTYRQYLKEQFPYRVYKVPIDAGFTCPNIDGTVAYGGCAYCDNKSFSPATRSAPRPVPEQVEDGIAFYRERFGAEKFIVYFQAFTNTHGPVERLRRLYDESLVSPDIVGLSIGTRPDCVPEEVLDLLAEYSDRRRLWVEYGLQSIHDETMNRLNRGHTYFQFEDAVRRTRRRGLPVCAHVILGLPGETPEMMMQTADAVAALEIDAVKIHHFYVARNTQMEKAHRTDAVPTLSLDRYVGLLCDFIERMPPGRVIERVMGELNPEYVVAPLWGKNKSEILRRIDSEFLRRGTAQGIRCAASGAVQHAP